MTTTDFLSLGEAAARLGVTPTDCLRLARAGELDYVEGDGTGLWFGVRIPSDAVRSYQARHVLKSPLLLSEGEAQSIRAAFPPPPEGYDLRASRDLARLAERARRIEDDDDLHGEDVVAWVLGMTIVALVAAAVWWTLA